MNSPTDHQLMLRVREGEVANLGHLFERHHERLYNFFVRLSGHRQLSKIWFRRFSSGCSQVTC